MTCKVKRAKGLLLMALFISILIANTKFLGVVKAGTTKVFVDPSSIKDYELVPDTNFTIRVNISNVEGLNAWQFNMTWDNTVLNVTGTDMIEEGPFLKSGGSTFFIATLLPENQIPHYMVVGATMKQATTASGNGTLAYVTFKVVGQGKTALDLIPYPGTKLLDLDGWPIDHTTEDGYFNNLPPPVASFTYTPEHPTPGQTITFNASSSYDLKGSITSYKWDFGDDNVTPVSDAIITHAYPAIGKYTVTLEVTDDDGYTDTFTDAVTVSTAPMHDVSVFDITPSLTKVTAGESVSINVTVSNDGDFTETFNVTAYYDSNTIGTQIVTDLANGTSKDLTFIWSTTGVPAGTYTMSAEAKLENDDYPGDNAKTDGQVTVVKPPIASFVYTPAAPEINQTVTFDASGSIPDGGTIVSYRWDFGDDNVTTVSDPIVTHAYTSAETYTVTLTVTDSEELNSTATESLTVGKLTSTVSIDIDPASASVDSNITISGAISPLRAGVEVGIYYKTEDGDWYVLTVVTTDLNSNYSYKWAPSKPGTYGIKASWLGDANTLSDESEEKIVTVEAASTSNIFLYVLGGIVIVILAATLIYFTKFRKTQAAK